MNTTPHPPGKKAELKAKAPKIRNTPMTGNAFSSDQREKLELFRAQLSGSK